MVHNKSQFKGSTVRLDGNSYDACTFERCKLVYSGGSLPSIVNCHFSHCTWVFEGAAQHTLTFMSQMYHGFDTGPAFIEQTFENIRRGPVNPKSNKAKLN